MPLPTIKGEYRPQGPYSTKPNTLTFKKHQATAEIHWSPFPGGLLLEITDFSAMQMNNQASNGLFTTTVHDNRLQTGEGVKAGRKERS